MTQEEVNNIKLVANFMNIKVSEFRSQENGVLGIALTNEEGEIDWELEGIDWYSPDTDWNQLIDIVNKILSIYAENEALRAKLNKDENILIKFAAKNMLATFENKFSKASTFNKVVDFIKWYYKNA